MQAAAAAVNTEKLRLKSVSRRCGRHRDDGGSLGAMGAIGRRFKKTSKVQNMNAEVQKLKLAYTVLKVGIIRWWSPLDGPNSEGVRGNCSAEGWVRCGEGTLWGRVSSVLRGRSGVVGCAPPQKKFVNFCTRNGMKCCNLVFWCIIIS